MSATQEIVAREGRGHAVAVPSARFPVTSETILLSLAFEPKAPACETSWRPSLWMAIALSLLFHLWLVVTFAGVVSDPHLVLEPEPIETQLDNQDLELPPDEMHDIELARPDDRELEVRPAQNATAVGVEIIDNPPMESAVAFRGGDFNPQIHDLPHFDIPQGHELSKTIVVPGTTGEAFVQVETALDRVTWEIASNLKEKRLLVVWLIDASGSLRPQREIVAKRFRRIYEELNALDVAEQLPKAERPLLSGVVAFGAQTTFVTKEPTDKFDDILHALQTAPIDHSGVENVFGAVSQVLDRWQRFRTEQHRRILLITITDEAGDDYGTPLEAAITKCLHLQAKAYVIGPAAPFGRRKGHVPYVAKENGKTYQIAVDLGPETVVVENVDLPFWYDGPQYDYLSSGFGPYALSRLVKETGGVYFMSNMATMAGLSTVGSFDSAVMKAFEPDYQYSSPAQFLRDMSKHPLRATVFAAADHSQSSSVHALGTPQMEFRVQPNNFRQAFGEAQKSAAVSSFVVDSMLSRISPQVDKWYATEPSLRWRLAFDLNYGRLLAQRVRAYEYNLALAQMKTSYTDTDIARKCNHFILRPSRELNYATNMKRQATAAEEHLQRVLVEAPGTPWALLASRELKDGLGIRVTERFIPPPPPVPPAKAQPAKPMPKILPEQQPNVPQQPQPKPPEPVLPKL